MTSLEGKKFIELVNKVFDETYEEVQRIRKITDLKQQAEESWKVMKETRLKWDGEVHDCFVRYFEENFGIWHDVSQGFADVFGGEAKRYEELSSPYQLLENVWAKADAKINPTNWQNPDKPKSPKQEKSHHQPQETNIWTCNNLFCPSIYQEQTVSYYYNTKTNDNKKFCSEECYAQEYGKYCLFCHKKSLKFQRHPHNPKHTYCLTCWIKEEEKLQEWKQIDKDLEKTKEEDLIGAMKKVAEGEGNNEENSNEKPITRCRYCDAKTQSPIIKWCQKKECVQKEIERVNNSRERERERAITTGYH